MDRKALAACAAGCTILACATGAAWLGSSGSASFSHAQPALLEAAQLTQCTWQQLDEPVVQAAPDLARPVQVERQPRLAAAVPLQVRQSAPMPAAGENPELSPEATRAGLVEPQDAQDESDSDADDDDQSIAAVSDSSDDTASPEAGPLQTPLPWAHANPRTPEMVALVKRTELRVRYGFQLTHRGAVYSARKEFISSLQMLADANDAQQGTRLYSRALAAGLTAVREAGVFVRHRADRPDVDISHIIATHKTPVLKNEEAARITPTFAAQRYYTYAQEQLAAAAANEVCGSMALFGLAKLMANTPGNAMESMEHTAQAMCYYQAALLAEPRNYLAANELGVLEVANGNLSRARELFVHSVSLVPRPGTWHNLVVVHTRLGETQLAEQAKQRMATTPQPPADQRLAVEWLDPSVFATTTPLNEGLAAIPPGKKAPAPKAPAAAQPASATEPAPTGSQKKSIADLLPWNSRH